MNRDPIAVVEAAVKALHPGPGKDFRFPEPEPRTAIERLVEAEIRFINLAVEHFAQRNGELGDLARRIIVMRAEQADQGARAHG